MNLSEEDQGAHSTPRANQLMVAETLRFCGLSHGTSRMKPFHAALTSTL